MSWLKIDDQFPDHPKVVRAGADAAWLHVCGLCYCARYLTDGEIPKGQVRKLADVSNPLKLAEKLCEVGLWFDAGNAFIVNDYLEYNPSREHVEREREKERRKKARGRANQGRDDRGRITGYPEGVPGGVPGGHLEGFPPVPSPSPYPGVSERETDVNDGLSRTGDPEESPAVPTLLADARQKLRGTA